MDILTGHYHETSGYRVVRREGVDDWLLIHTVAGSGRFGYDGGELVTGPNDWTLLRPHTLHDYGVAGARAHWELLWAHFRPRPEWAPLLRWPVVHEGLMALTFAASDSLPIAARFEQAHTLLSAAVARREMVALNALEDVLLRCDALNPLARDQQLDQRIRAATEYLALNLDKKIVLDDVAGAVGLSPSRLAHLFRSETGDTPQQHLEGLRMRRAADLLRRTGFSIKQIAAATGFESPFYFSQRFKAWSTKSPSDFRRDKG